MADDKTKIGGVDREQVAREQDCGVPLAIQSALIARLEPLTPLAG